MNAHVAEPQMESAITTIEAEPGKALSARAVFDEFHAALSAEVNAHVPDLTTDKGRKAIASLSHRVTKAKTAIDAAGKKLNEDLRARINVVDAERRYIRESLDTLADRARKPLTDWEEAEEARQKAAQDAINRIRTLGLIDANDTVDMVKARLNELLTMSLDANVLRDQLTIAEGSIELAIKALTTHRDRLVKEAADRAELDRLRAEAAEHDRVERERQEAEAAAKIAAEAEANRKAEEEKRIADAVEETRIKAEREAEAKARQEQEERDRAHRAEVDRIEREAAERERLARAESDRLRREKEAADAEVERKAAEDARRAADVEHRGSIMRAVKEAIISAAGIDEAKAKLIVKAIVDGSVPHTAIQF